MFITSMGIFGFLSKAHIEQTSVSADNTLQIEAIDSQISRQQKDIERAELQLGLLDDALKKYVELGAVTKSINARQGQEEERNALTTTINNATNNIANLTEKKYELRTKQNELVAEVRSQSNTSPNLFTETLNKTPLKSPSDGSSSS